MIIPILALASIVSLAIICLLMLSMLYSHFHWVCAHKGLQLWKALWLAKALTKHETVRPHNIEQVTLCLQQHIRRYSIVNNCTFNSLGHCSFVANEVCSQLDHNYGWRTRWRSLCVASPFYRPSKTLHLPSPVHECNITCTTSRRFSGKKRHKILEKHQGCSWSCVLAKVSKWFH